MKIQGKLEGVIKKNRIDGLAGVLYGFTTYIYIYKTLEHNYTAHKICIWKLEHFKPTDILPITPHVVGSIYSSLFIWQPFMILIWL